MSRDALVVGINQYSNLPRLTAASKDAEGVANLLETYGNFRVRRLPETIQNQRPQVASQTLVSAQQLETCLVRLLMPKGDHIPEAAFFYFSGHGLQREIGIREGYLAASDTQPQTSNSGLSLSWLRRLIKSSPVRQIIVILDCCHSGEFLSLKDEAWQGGDGQSYLFVAASREYEEAYESLDSDYSVLTQAMITGLLPQQSSSGRVASTDLVASITNQLSSELQQPLFEQGGSEIVITQQSEYSLPKSESISIISRIKQYSFNFCPYRGPQPFEAKHADYYFGRESLIQKVLQTLQNSNLCALIGASGSGKTSLLQAGIIPRLSEGNDILGSEHWVVRYVTLGKQPLKTLAAAFTIAQQEEVDTANQLCQAEVLLRNESTGLANLVAAALLKQPAAKKFWLIIDQFEDLLISTSEPQVQTERCQVIDALITALCDPSSSLGIIVSLRSDTLDALTSYGEMFSLLENNRVVIPPMNYQAIRDVIEKPAEKIGLKLDPYLVHNLTLDLTGAPGELALLQSALYELWQHRSVASYSKGGPCLLLDSYIKLGGLSQMLANRATTVYESLTSDEQTAAQRIFIALCDLGEGRFDQCRSTRKAELINQRFPSDLIERTLQKLVSARLLVSDKPELAQQIKGQISNAAGDTHTQSELARVARWPVMDAGSEETIELAHKSLVLDWSLLRQWLQTQRSSLRQQRDIEQRAWIWHQQGESKNSDYLLKQQYLNDIRPFLLQHSQDLSYLAQRFIDLSGRVVTYQRWRTRGVAVLLPFAVMAGMTVSLVHNQFNHWSTGRAPIIKRLAPKQPSQEPTSMLWVEPLLPAEWGMLGAERLASASQILAFKRKHLLSNLNQVSATQLVNLMKPSVIMANSMSLPDSSNSLTKDKEGW
ncbi:MAG: caspase domain-containing protein [Leptolyngbyaceae cyanobacterium]